MLTRLGALMIVAGLGVGVLLRVVLGRRRMPALVAIAHLPVLVHVVLVIDAGRRAGIGAPITLLFAGAGLALGLAGTLLGRSLHARRPWIAALTPALTAAVYLLVPVLLYNHQLAQTAVRLGSLATFGYTLSTVFFVAVLLTFAPRGGRPGAGRLQP